MKLYDRINEDIIILMKKFDLIGELVELIKRYQKSKIVKSEISFFKKFQMRAHLFRN
ncbi:MAG: hypothetical protein NZ927_07320 [Candidatus Calescibacterium sp.]|nr:hypothetical protein [Candidatus Calescibacterium sp.]MCX7734469.1 hypothetical protein [bacterium]MDW8087337.1 hypothetical protein [Candidatus Calescibacterium sp.]